MFLSKIHHNLIIAVIHVHDLPTSLIVRSSNDNAVTKLVHKMTVSNIALSQAGPISERQLALLDYNRDLYVVTVKDPKPKFVKLGKFYLHLYSLATELQEIDKREENKRKKEQVEKRRKYKSTKQINPCLKKSRIYVNN